MKRLTAALLLLVLTMGLCTGAMAESTADYIGTWVISKVRMNGGDVKPADVGMGGDTWIIKLDGTCCTYRPETDTLYGTWALNGNGITMTLDNGSVIDYVLSNGQMMFKNPYVTYTYERHSQNITAADMATILSDQTMESFSGHWWATSVRTAGTTQTAKEAGVELGFTFNGTHGNYILTTADSFAVADLSFELTEVEGVGTVLTCRTVNEKGKTVTALTLLRTSDGKLLWDASDETTDTLYILEP